MAKNRRALHEAQMEGKLVMLVLFLVIIVPTLLLTLRTFRKLDRLSQALTIAAKWIVLIGMPFVFMYVVFHTVTNWHQYTLEDHLTKLASILAAGILVELTRKFIRRVEAASNVEDAKDRSGEGL